MFSLFIYSAMITAGVSVVGGAITANFFVESIIEETMVAIAHGEPLSNFSLEIMALMSGGTLLVIPIWLQIALSASGLLMVWFGWTGIGLYYEGGTWRDIFSRRYMKTFQKTFSYSPYDET